MRALARAIAAMAACGCAGSALAQEGSYSGLSFVSVSYREDGFPSADPQAVAFKLGLGINRYLAVEARAGFGVGEDTVTYLGAPVEVKIDQYFGVYGKGILPLMEDFSVYGLLGVIGGKVTATGFGYQASQSDTDVSFGAGLDLVLSKHIALNFEWAELFKDTGYKVRAASFGLVYKH